MENIDQLFIFSIPMLAIALTIFKTKTDKLPMRFFKLAGVLFSSLPIVGIVQGVFVKKQSPLYSQACFTQAIYCGFGFVFISLVLPYYL